MDQGFTLARLHIHMLQLPVHVSFLRPRLFSTTVSVDADERTAPRHVLRNHVLVLVTDKREPAPIEQDEDEGING
jgi:hypothetical protein